MSFARPSMVEDACWGDYSFRLLGFQGVDFTYSGDLAWAEKMCSAMFELGWLEWC